MVKLTKSIELSLSDILEAIDLLSPDELKIIIQHLTDEKTGIKLVKYKNMPKTIDLEKMMEERGYKGVNWHNVDALVDEIDVQESTEELLKQLTE